MKQVLNVFCKNGREHEAGPFSSLERAQADAFFGEYYLPVIKADDVSDAVFDALVKKENEDDGDADMYGEPTRYDRYKAIIEKSAQEEETDA